MQRTYGLDSTRSNVASLQQVDEQARLAMAATRERAQAVVVAPGVAVAGLRVANQIDGHARFPFAQRGRRTGI